MAVIRTLAEIQSLISDQRRPYKLSSLKQLQMDANVILTEINAASAGGGGSTADLTGTEALLAELKTLLTDQTTSDGVESDETQVILYGIETALGALEAANQTESDETQAAIKTEGDETQAKIDALISASSDTANLIDVVSITNGAVGTALRGVSVLLVGGGAKFNEGSGTINGIPVPLGYSASFDSDGKSRINSDLTLTAAGGAHWVTAIKS